VRVVHSKVIDEYEHLDVIWAMDCIEKVGKEVKEVLWRTCDVRDQVRIPRGCEGVERWRDPKYERESEMDGGGGEEEEEGQSSSSAEEKDEDVL
jgi:hypothetical protein